MNKIEELRDVLDEVVQKIKIIKALDSDGWMNMKMVTLYTSLSESTIRRAINSGHLKVYRSTGRLLFRRSHVDEWLEGK